jgi:hypothetical protein
VSGSAGRWNEARESFSQRIERIQAVGRTHVVTSVHQTARGIGSGTREKALAVAREREAEAAQADDRA